MLQSIWLVARREYIGYVSALGFWLGLLLTPLGLAIGLLLPSLLIESQPVRYYTVVDSSDEVVDALQWQFESWQSNETQTLLQQAIASYSPPEKRRIISAYENARAEDKSPQDALDLLDIDIEITASPIGYQYIALKHETRANLERALTSGRTFSGPDGQQPLYAIISVNRDQVGEITSVDYLSSDVVNPQLKTATTGALKYLARMELFRQAEITPFEIRKADATIPDLFVRKPGETQPPTASQSSPKSEVTLTDHAPYAAAAAIAFALWLLIFSVINFLLTGTIEERSNKIFDSLLTSIRLSELLAGKLLGVFMLSATLMGAWLLMALWAALNAGEIFSPAVLEFASAALTPNLILPALAGFLAGYLMYGAIFLAMGSLCDTIQEAQSLATPIIILLTVPLIMVGMALQNPSSTAVLYMSWVPLFTPFLMILRAPLEPSLIEICIHLVIMFISTWVAITLSIKVYRTGAVHGTGMKEIGSGLKNMLGLKTSVKR